MPSVVYGGRPVEFVGEYTGGYDCLNRGSFYEIGFLEHVRALDLSGTYLDIGTNIGNHALYFKLFCNSERVIGFEPVQHWRARALANLSANDCDVDVRPVGLLDEPGELIFNPYGTPFRLECTTLDAALPDLCGVTFVKLDIEGSEPKALLGGREFFRRNRPVIFAECLGDPAELLAAAAVIGYRQAGEFRSGCSPMLELRPA